MSVGRRPGFVWLIEKKDSATDTAFSAIQLHYFPSELIKAR